MQVIEFNIKNCGFLALDVTFSYEPRSQALAWIELVYLISRRDRLGGITQKRGEVVV